MRYTPSHIKTTILNGVVEKEVYIEQPLGVETHDRQTHVCKLKKALHNTYSYMRNLKITWSDEYLNLFYKVEDEIL